MGRLNSYVNATIFVQRNRDLLLGGIDAGADVRRDRDQGLSVAICGDIDCSGTCRGRDSPDAGHILRPCYFL